MGVSLRSRFRFLLVKTYLLQVFSKGGPGTSGIPETVTGGYKVKVVFIIVLRHHLPLVTCILLQVFPEVV